MSRRDDPYAAGSSLSRRDFLVGSAGLWISVSLPRTRAAAAAATSSQPQTFSSQEWRAVEAISSRIIPTDDLPGAREAGCVNFIDKALVGEDADAAPAYHAALAELDRICRKNFGGAFADLTATQQDALLTQLEAGEIEDWLAQDASPEAFFATVRIHTILGFVLDPRHGGNRDYAGWRAMGFPGPVHHLGGALPEHMTGEVRFVPIWERSKKATKPHS